jgi:hypothetical protein
MLFQFPEQYLIYETVPGLLHSQEKTAGKKDAKPRPEQRVIKSDAKTQAIGLEHPD